MGDWTGTVPTFTAGARLRGVDMATMAAIAAAQSKTVDYRWKWKFGAGSAVGTAPTLTLPFTPSADWVATADIDRMWIGSILDTNTSAQRDMQVYLSAAPATVTLNYMNAGVPAQITATAPWTWAAGDTLAIYGRYYTD
jgi:hypothetical protein